MRLAQQNLGKPLLHIIDREADSAGHLRQWSDNKHLFLVRVKANNTLTYQDVSQKCQDIVPI